MTEFKVFSNIPCCLNCDGFFFWDGDYCCFPNFKIHQYGWPHQIWFDRDIDKTMQTPETCEDYSYRHHERYPESQNEFKREYRKFKEWDRLCYQLEQHVTNKWKDPKVENTIACIHNQYFNKYYN